MSQCHLTCSGVKRLPQKCPVVSWWCGLEYMVDSGHLISQIFRGRPGRDGFYTPQTSWILEPLMTDHLSPWPNHNFGLHGAPNSPSTNAMLRPHALWHQRHGSWIGLETEAAAQWIRRTSFKTYPSMFDGFIFSRAVGDWVQKYVFFILKKLVLALPFQFLSRCPWSLVG